MTTSMCRCECGYVYSLSRADYVPCAVVVYEPDIGIWTTSYLSLPEDDTQRVTYNLSATFPATATRQDKTLRQRPQDIDDS